MVTVMVIMVMVVVVMVASPVAVLVVMPTVAAWLGSESKPGLLAGEKILHCIDGIALLGSHCGDAARGHVLRKASAETL